MSEKKSGLSDIVTVILAIVIIVRIAMIMGRQGSSANPNWDNNYLIWSIFVLVFIIGFYFWNANKSSNDSEE